jgi:hypothetical protein
MLRFLKQIFQAKFFISLENPLPLTEKINIINIIIAQVLINGELF